MQFKINLATRNYINTRQLNLVIGTLFTLLLCLLLLAIRAVATNGGEMDRIARELVQLQQSRSTTKTVSDKEYQALLARIRLANGIIGTKSYNWLQLLDRLEEVVPDNVALTGIEPDPKDGGLKITGTARSFSNLRHLMENIEAAKFFSEIYLTSQSEAKVSEQQKGLNFTIACKVAFK